MKLAISLALLGLLLSAHPALALPLSKDDYEAFLRKSRKDPKRVYVLKVSATWCGPCKYQARALRALPRTKAAAIGRAHWNEVDVDLDEERYRAFLKTVGIPTPRGFPTNIAFKDGKPVGQILGWDAAEMEKFLSEAALIIPGKGPNNATDFIPKFPCNPNRDADACVWGLSSPQGPQVNTTDDFGRANLKMFASLFNEPRFKKLFAPEPPTISLKKSKTSEAELYVRNPFADMAGDFERTAGAAVDLDKLADQPGRNVRVLFTGHGGPDGMDVDYRKKSPSELKTPDEYPWEDKILSPSDMEAAVRKARLAKKDVRAVIVQCFGGVFGDAFMPLASDAGAGCAAFATIPEKMAEGCYSAMVTAERDDYLGMASKLKKCDGSQNARDLHYAIVAAAKGHDVPMLSSEYFLLHGPGAALLGDVKSVAAPPFGIVRKTIKSDWGAPVTVYLDRVNAKVLKIENDTKDAVARPFMPKNKASISADETSCAEGSRILNYNNSAAPSKGPVYANLTRRHIGHKLYSDCDEKVTFNWKKSDMSYELLNELSTSIDPSNPAQTDLSGLTEAEKRIDAADLKVDARLLLAHVVPFFTATPPDLLRARLHGLALDIGKFDPPRAAAIETLLKSVPANLVNVDALTQAALNNSSDRVIADGRIGLTRLAHLLATALAERDLRERARTDDKAAKLVKQLDALRDCEKDLL